MKVLFIAASGVRHTTKAVIEAVLILAIAVALILGTAALGGFSPGGADSALAARGGNGNGGSSIWIATSTARTADGGLQFGQSLTFGYTSDTAQSIQLRCYQPADALVFSAAQMLFEGGLGYGQPFTLGPSLAWTSGAASCTASLGHRSNSGRYVVEATVTFAVGA